MKRTLISKIFSLVLAAVLFAPVAFAALGQAARMVA